MKIYLLFAMSFCLLISSIKETKSVSLDSYRSSTQEFAVGALIGSAVIGTGFALYKLKQWICKKTDKEIYDEALLYYRACEHTLDDSFPTSYKFYLPVYFNAQVYIEEYLDTIDSHLLRKIEKKGIDAYLISIIKQLEELNKHYSSLDQHLLEMRNNSSQNYALMQNMKKLKKSIKKYTQDLSDYSKFITKYRYYFKLHKIVYDLCEKYDYEIYKILQLNNDENLQKEIIRIIKNKSTDSYNFSYLDYVNDLNEDLSTLNHLLETKEKEQCQYPKLISSAHTLAKKLESIKDIVIKDPSYHDEVLKKIENQAIAINRQRDELNRVRSQLNNYQRCCKKC